MTQRSNTKMQDLITILTPLHYRLKYVRRQLEHTESLNCTRLVIDSSKSCNRDYLNGFDVAYLHYPDCLYYKKIFRALGHVTTPYVMHLPDDDIVLKRGLISCLELLENEPTLIGAAGFQARLRENSKQLDFRYRRLQFLWDRALMSIFYFPSSTFWLQAKAFLGFYEANHFVYRTEILREWMKYSIDNPASQPMLINEKLFQLWTSIRGGLGLVSDGLLVRSDDRMVLNEKAFLQTTNNRQLFSPTMQLDRTPWGEVLRVVEKDHFVVHEVKARFNLNDEDARKVMGRYFKLVEKRSTSWITKIFTYVMDAFDILWPKKRGAVLKNIEMEIERTLVRAEKKD